MRDNVHSLVIAAAALVAATVAASDAEAKRRGGLGIFTTAPSRGTSPIPSATPRIAPAVGVAIPLSAGAQARPPVAEAPSAVTPPASVSTSRFSLIGSAFAAPAAPPSPAASSEPAAASPGPPREWCPTKRIVGSGVGFCEIR